MKDEINNNVGMGRLWYQKASLIKTSRKLGYLVAKSVAKKYDEIR